jgi:CubicO group peptidase (beta-lactamase class C family)
MLLLAGAAVAAPVIAAPFVLRRDVVADLRDLTRPEPTAAPVNDPEAVAAAEAVVAPWMAGKSAPGAVLGVIRGGRPILKWGYGMRALSDPATPDPDTVFHIASVAKPVTGYALLLLVQDGRIQLDAPASAYLPELPVAWAPITVRQFLSHVSGIKTVPAFFGDDWLKALAGAAKVPVRPAGRELKYNNFNYVVLGQLIERISGMSYAGFVQQRIFDPLGMTRSFVGRGEHPNQARGNMANKTGWFTPTQTSLAAPYWAPAGWMQSSLNDVMAFVSAVQTKTLLKEPVWENVVRRYAPDIRGAGGWFAKTFEGVPLWEKLGRIAGFSTDVEFNARGDAIVLMWNCQTYRDDSIVARTALRHRLFGLGTGELQGPRASVLNEQKWG